MNGDDTGVADQSFTYMEVTVSPAASPQKRRGRPRLHPPKDPNVPKKSRGRPRKSDTGMVGVNNYMYEFNYYPQNKQLSCLCPERRKVLAGVNFSIFTP